MLNNRRLGVLAGSSYFLTHVTSVAAVALYGPMLLPDSGWASEGGAGTIQLVGAILDVLLALGVVGSAVFLVPLLRPMSGLGGVGYLVLRSLEAAVILVGVAAVIGAVTMRAADADPASTDVLVMLYRQAFLVGPGLVVPVHTVLLAFLLWRHRLAPRFIAVLGFVGGPLVLVSNLTVLFGVQEQVSAAVMLAAVPVFAWEISLALRLITRSLHVPEPA